MSLKQRSMELLREKLEAANVPVEVQMIVKGWADVFLQCMKEAQRELSRKDPGQQPKP